MDDTLVDVAGRLGRLVKAQRTAMGLSLGELGREAGLSKTIVAKIESGEGNPSVETLWRLSRALALPMGALLSGHDEPRTHVIRARSGRSPASESGMQAWLVHAEGRERRTEVFELAFDAGVEHAGTPHLPGTEELVFCVSGRLAAGPVGEEVELGAGDAVRFAADAPHVYRGIRAARAIDLILYPAAPR
jgi:transcriptional regulator with XRE-family HTH domain